MSKALSRILAVVLCFSFCTLLSAVSFAQKAHSAAGAQTGETRTGIWRGRLVTYQVIDGRNIYEGDIILDNVQPAPAAGIGGVKPESVGIAYPQFMWPLNTMSGVHEIPYTIDPANMATQKANIMTAIGIYNSTFTGVIQFVPYVSQPNWVNIFLDANNMNGECEADEGDDAGYPFNVPPQQVTGSGSCTIATILHEFGHVTGVWHEQSRPDRNTYVTVNYGNVIRGSQGNVDQVYDDIQPLTPYDYASVMEYPAFAFTRNGGPVIDSIPPGMPLSNLTGYSAADIEGIKRLYGAPPTQITVTSNPPGLSVIVDGSTITTPQTFTWALNSMHTLNVAPGVQTVMGDTVDSDPPQPTTFYYTYGRWNDNTAASHTITVTPGNGDVPFPSTSPQVSTYSANFVQLVPFTYTASPSGSGTVAATGVPLGPQSYAGVSGVYFVARQQATLTATAAATYQFYAYLNGPYYLAGGIGANPKTFYVPDSGLTVDPFTEFTTYPIYHVDVSPDPFSSNLLLDVDDADYFTPPKNFSPDPNLDGSAWAPSTTHTLDFLVLTQYPFSLNSRYAFDSWNAGTSTSPTQNTVTLPASPPAVTNYTATLTPQFLAGNNFTFACGGTATISPSSPTDDGFYNSGTPLTYTATPDSTWTFAGWTYDITGTANPAHLTPTDESLVYANFNTTNSPLTLTSLSPSTIASGGLAFTITLTGTGFTSGSIVGINFFSSTYTPLTVTSVTSTQIKATVPMSAIATPGGFQIYVENFPSGWSGCANFGMQTFIVSNGTPTPAIAPSPTTLTFSSQAMGTTSPGQVVTVNNTGTAVATISTVTPSGDFAETNTCIGAVNAGESCTITVTFTPTATGTRTGSISIADNASGSPQKVTLTGTGTGSVIVAPTPTSLGFGSQRVGTTSASQQVTVNNTGTGNTTISISPSGDFAIASSPANTCVGTLNAGGSCTFYVTFTPTTTGTRTGSITITDQAANTPQMVSLTGTGTSAVVAPTPTSLTFSSQQVGTTSAGQQVTVNNTGTANSTISVAPSGDFAIATSPANTCVGTLNAGGSCTFNVTFTPTATGTRTGAITITDQAANTPQMVSLTGTGTSGGTVVVTATPTSETFASQTVGTTSAGKTVTVKNTGTASTPLTIAPATGDFAQTNNCPTTLGPSPASCTITVTFTPTATGTRTGSISITDNASNSPQTVSLTGTGKAATVVITVTPATLTFASQAVGTTSPSKTVTVKNTGTGSTPLTIGAATGNFSQTNNCPTTLGPSPASCTITVTFSPLSAGSLTGAISITDNASNSPQSVTLKGTGTSSSATLTFTPTSETFTSTAVGSTSAGKVITLKNTGGGTATLSSITASGDFARTTTCGGTLAGGGSCTITATFTPTVTGSVSGAITVVANTTKSPQVASLTGTGIAPLTFSPVSLAFGSVAVGVTSAPKTVTMTNNQSTTLNFSFATSANYSTAGGGTTCGTSLTAGAQCTLSVTFTPTAPASIDGATTVTYTGAYSPVGVKFTGKGTGGTTAPLKFTPVSLSFAKQATGTTSAGKTVTVKNQSASSVTINSIAASGNFAAAGSGGTPCGGALAAGASCTISATFAPSISGAIEGAVVISDNASSENQQVVNLTGTAVLPVTIAPTSLTFASTTVGTTSAAQTLTITNNLTTTLSSLSFTASGDFSATAGGGTPCGSSVAAGATCTLSVTFTPSTTGSIKGAVTVTDSAGTSPQTLKLTGTGS